MLRNISDRARVEGMRAFQNLLGGLRGQLARRPAGDLYLVRAPRSEHRAGETVWWSRDEPGATAGKSGASAPGGLSAGDVEVTKSLDRIAETIDRLAAQLDAFHHERAENLDAIAEAIDGGGGPRRYRLTRRSDGIPLPIMFDARDVRAAASTLERQATAD